MASVSACPVLPFYIPAFIYVPAFQFLAFLLAFSDCLAFTYS